MEAEVEGELDVLVAVLHRDTGVPRRQLGGEHPTFYQFAGEKVPKFSIFVAWGTLTSIKCEKLV